MEVDDEKRQHSHLNAGRNDDRGQRVAQEFLNMPPLEIGRDRRLEEFVADVGARHVCAPFAVIPKQRFRKSPKPARAIRRIWRPRRRPPGTDTLHSCQQRHCDQNDRQHGNES